MTTQGQIVIDNTVTLDEAIATLLGPNIQFSNVTFSGDANQLGYFDATNSNVGIATGIILGTGDVINAEGPNDGSSSSIGGGNFGASDADLDDLDGLTHNDAAILEFDFIATGTAVSFDYVWASEEYPEFTGAGSCGNVSDVFGFFLSGPGISGPFINNADNIALIPGTSDFVSIFNLNAGCTGTAVPGDVDCNNCEYYINNGDGVTAPFNTDNFYVQYDGLTVVLTAVYEGLVCGETYHIKLAVADVSDTAFDSAVFLQEGSFDVYGNLISAVVANPNATLGDNAVLEGCIDGSFLVQPPGCQTEPLEITLEATGSATMGADYANIPLTITLSEEPIIIPITTIADGAIEGNETITLSFTYTDIEGNEQTASATLNLVDYMNPTLAALEDLFICPGTTQTSTAVVSNGFGPFAYSWTSGALTASETFSQGDAGEYTVTVTDFCENTATANVLVTEPAPLVVLETVEVCVQGESESIVEGGVTPYTYTYDELALDQVGDDDVFTGIIPGIYTISVEDDCGSVGQCMAVVIVCDTKIPNIFTPNGDTFNQFFEIYGIEQFPRSKFTVWNRWGTIIYESENYQNKWDGTDAPDGTYFYVFERSDGEVFSGHITLLTGK
ncbi:MAG: choice-of-anchor L domain-containing protein [Flavobacteriales bacterium]